MKQKKSLTKKILLGGLGVGCLALSLWFGPQIVDKIPIHSKCSSLKLEQRLNGEKKSKNNKRDKYALLIATGGEHRYRNNISEWGKTLSKNNFKRENTYILTKFGWGKVFDFNSDGPSTNQNIRKVLKHLSKKIDDKDLFLFYLNGHGEEHDKGSKLCIQPPDSNNCDDYITDSEIAHYLSKIRPKPYQGIFIVDACHSGGFLDIVKPNKKRRKNVYFNKNSEKYAILTSSKAEETSFSAIDFADFINSADSMNSFGGHLARALNPENINESDSNSDKRVSIKEAFDYVMKHHSPSKYKQQTPLYYSKKGLNKIFID